MPDGTAFAGTATTLPFGVIVLAGGKAARLGGADKPGIIVGQRTLLAAVVSAATAAGAGHVVVVGPPPPGRRTARGLCFVREDPPGAGPVPALRRGLAEVCEQHPAWGGDASRPQDPPQRAQQWVAVLAADLPFFRASHLRALLAAAIAAAAADRLAAGAVLVDDAGRPQWLAGCWRADALRAAADAYGGSSLRGLLGPLRPALLRIGLAPGEPPPWLDCDTPEDVRRAREWSG